jgi:phytanoyl-CoA hydroxylase
MSLTPEQTWLFRHNGFLKLPEPLPGAFVAELKAAVLRDIENEVAPVVKDRHGRVVRISDLWGRGGVFREALTRSEVLDPLESLLGPNIELILNRHNHATLRLADDGTSYLHRDVLQWSRPIVTVLYYLEETTLENGCTHVIPGSHFFPGRPDMSVENDDWARSSGVLEQAVPVPMPAGGLVVMNSLVIHTAGANRTPHSRMSLTVGYHSVDELAGVDNPRRVVVRGERIYRGNY